MTHTGGENGAIFWRTAFAEHRSVLLAFLASRLQRLEDAEDLLQETFVRAIRAEEGLRDPKSVRSFLFTIAHRLTLNHYRKRREQLFSESEEGFEEAVIELPGSVTTSPDNRTDEHQLAERLNALLGELSKPLQQAFHMGVLEKLPYAEIALRMGWTLAQVKINVYRARKSVITGLTDWLPASGGVS